MNPTIVIDNGSYNIKIGAVSVTNETISSPHIIPNCLVRTNDRRLLIGETITNNKNISRCYIKRPFDHNQLISWDVQKLIWDYCLNSNDCQLEEVSNSSSMDFNEVNLLVTELPFLLPRVEKNMDQIVFEEYGFSNYYKNIPASFIPFSWVSTEKFYKSLNSDDQIISNVTNISDKSAVSYGDFTLVVDSGFDSTVVVPMLFGKVYWPAVRKLDIGGRLLTGYLKEIVLFRQFDILNETILANNIKEAVLFAALDYGKQQLSSKNTKESVCEYVLPDFKTTTTGYLLTPEKHIELASKLNTSTASSSKSKSSLIYEDLSVLKLSEERFHVPEVLLDPQIANIQHRPGLVQIIKDSINKCPELSRPMLAANIVLVGGNFRIPHLADRVLIDLKKSMPVEWDIRIACKPESADLWCWESMTDFVKSNNYSKVSVNKLDYFEKGWGYINEKLGLALQWARN